MKIFILTRKRLMAIGAALAVVFCIGAANLAKGDEAVATNAEQRNIPIYCVESDEKKVSISFDAAWGNEQTQSLLDTLAKYNIKSTFFLVGDWVRNYPDDVKAIAAAGHDVGNHSNTHPYMTQIDKSKMSEEVDTCNKEIEALTGKKPSLFRPPYGDYDNNVVSTVNNKGMYCVQWDVDSLDWKNLTAEEMCSRIKNNIKCGSIILMHNGAENTPEALPMIIECIQELGYEIVPISELLPAGEYTTDHTGMMIPKNKAESDSKSTDNSGSDSAKQTAAEVASAENSADAEAESRLQNSGTNSIASNISSANQGASSVTGQKTELSDIYNLNSKK